jgi:hypothetical protein
VQGTRQTSSDLCSIQKKQPTKLFENCAVHAAIQSLKILCLAVSKTLQLADSLHDALVPLM